LYMKVYTVTLSISCRVWRNRFAITAIRIFEYRDNALAVTPHLLQRGLERQIGRI